MKNYVHTLFGFTALVSVMVVLLRYLPEETVQGAGLKPVDILSGLNDGNDPQILDRLPAELYAGTDIAQEYEPVPVSDTAQAVNVLASENRPATPVAASVPPAADTVSRPAEAASADTTENGVVPILDYSPGHHMLPSFLVKLQNIEQLDRPVRIGFMGDSFIEGDLLTGDFRELMQERYGGRGVGFVPITSHVAGFRQTVTHRFGDWRQSSIVDNSKKEFTITAYTYTPSEGGYVEYRGSRHKRHLERFGRARLLFTGRGNTTITAKVNGDRDTTLRIHPSEELQEFVVEGDIERIRYTVKNVEGFTALGVYLEDSTGIAVDNFSVRGNSGAPMHRVSPALSGQLSRLARYDLIVLEYGLNVVTSDVTDYSAYQKQMTDVVEHLKHCFPGTAILIMSAGDRGTRRSGKVVTMPGIRAMVEAQQQVARECGVLFWNTYEMMRAEGGIESFVKKGWAAKDYTHIGAKGGRRIAAGLFEALTATAPR